MAKRAETAARRRQDWHQSRIDAAPTPKRRLWAACGWLVSEAWRHDRLDDAVDAVLTAVDNIREEASNGRY